MTAETELVQTSAGAVVGTHHKGVRVWRSIPYARPPAGPLRLRAPQPHDGWIGVRDCSKFAFCAPQNPRATFVGLGKRQPMSEDCLTLNITGPARGIGDRLPVVFFIHGGGPVGSSATPIYDGTALARRGCVFVSANYRIGALGALDLSSLATPELPIEGNLYLRDLVMALTWVRENIANFGGDPANITVMGESAGGHAVVALLALPAAQGLFSRAITQSPFLGMIRSVETSERIAHQFAAVLGCPPESAAQAIMGAEPQRLVAAFEQLTSDILARNPGDMSMIGATVDGQFLPHDPFDAIALGYAHRVPLIVGHTADEATVFDRFVRVLPTTAAAIGRTLADLDVDRRTTIYQAYPGYPRRSDCVQLGADLCFNSAAWRIAESHNRYAPTYAYRYDYSPRPLRWLGLGATHTTDLLPLFDVYRMRWAAALTAFGDRGRARRVSDDMQAHWVNFAASGEPTADWPAYEPADRSVLVIDHPPYVARDPHRDRRIAWEGFVLER